MNNPTSEKTIERYLCERCRAIGGVCLKFSSALQTGWPDRIMLLPDGRTVWVELKSTGKNLTYLQSLRYLWLRDNAHRVYKADSKEAVDKIFDEL